MKFDLFLTAMFLTTAIGVNANAQNPDNADQSDAATPLEAPSFDTELDAAIAEEIDRLILELGSPDYHEREAATRRLMEIGAPAFGRLRDEYHASDDLEVRLRTEVIVREGFMNYQVFDRTGYLGISIARKNRFPNHEDDARIPIGSIGIRLGEIKKNTAAAKAKLKVDDIITHVDGQPLGKGNIHQGEVFNAFAKTIRDRGVGGKLGLRVLRRDRSIEVVATLGAPTKKDTKLINGLSTLVNRSNAQFYGWWADNFSTSPPARGQSMGLPRDDADVSP